MDGQRFEPEIVRLMGIAFEMALFALQHSEATLSPTRDEVARKIIELSKAGERNPERLCEQSLQALRTGTEVIVTDPNPLLPLAVPPEPPSS